MEVRRNQWEGWIYLLPTLILLAVFTIYPLFRTFFMAFCEGYTYSIDAWDSFGIGNFRNILTGAKFLQYLKTTCLIVFISVPVSVGLSLLIAVGLNSIKKFSKIYQTIFFMPYVTNSIAIGMVFSVMFAGDRSIVNSLLNALNITPVNWLGGLSAYGKSPTYSQQMLVLMIYIVWHSLPFKILVLLSGLQGIDKQYYQAAQIDCATRFTVLTKITMPLLSPQIAFLTTTSFIGAFKEYSSVVGLFGDNEGAVGCQNDMRTIVGYIYASLQDDRHGAVGEACAASVLLFFIVMLFTILKNFVGKRQVHY